MVQPPAIPYGDSVNTFHADRRQLVRPLLRPLVDPMTWNTVSYSMLDLPIGVAAVTATVIALAVTIGLLVTFFLAVAVLAVFVPGTYLAARLERARVQVFLGETINPPRRVRAEGLSWWRRLWRDLRGLAFWKAVAYFLLLLPFGIASFTVTIMMFSTSLALLTSPLYVRHVPDQSLDLAFVTVRSWPGVIGVSLLGALLLLASAWMMKAVRIFEIAFVRTFLGTPRSVELTELTERVGELADTRARVIDAADVERQRIERDLHDGTQQRLVSLALQLGMAREKLDSDPQAARVLVDQAHRDAKQALVELRNIVRGIHPPLLTERGLTAAVQSLGTRAGLPVHVHADLDALRDRPSSSIEGIAYYVVSECLANVAKHARGASAWVMLGQSGKQLSVEVRDDGPGGASLREGGGLAGLRDRVAAVDGSLRVVSPPGGPTSVLALLPYRTTEA
jgi:signal transduction histidine kinase